MQNITYLKEDIRFISSAAVGTTDEGEGPLGRYFDLISDDALFGMSTYERAEGEMSRISMNLALAKANLDNKALNLIISGDLQNQCIASSGGLFSFGAPYLGIYGACSTLTEGLIVGAAMAEAAKRDFTVGIVTSSHNAAAERQFRTPLEYGAQRAPTTQWTASAAGSFIITSKMEIAKNTSYPKISAFRPGRIIDSYSCDPNNMGAAMAPAAFDSIVGFFEESGDDPLSYDIILSGDLGLIGSSILHELLHEKIGTLGDSIISRHKDAGLLLYDMEVSDIHAGASGCGCSAAVLSTFVIPAFLRGDFSRVLLMSTGALLSSTSTFQKESIFGIAPIIKLEK